MRPGSQRTARGLGAEPGRGQRTRAASSWTCSKNTSDCGSLVRPLCTDGVALPITVSPFRTIAFLMPRMPRSLFLLLSFLDAPFFPIAAVAGQG